MVLGNSNMLRKSIANDLMKSGVGDGLITSNGKFCVKGCLSYYPLFVNLIKLTVLVNWR